MIMVDPLRQTPNNKNWLWKETCHMFTDCPENLDELHRTAAEIGLKREWFQEDNNSMPHYDLTKQKMLQALLKGAHQVTNKEAAHWIKAWRKYRKTHIHYTG